MLRRLITLPLVFLIVLTSPVTGGPSRGSAFGTTPDWIRLTGHVPAALQRATRLPGIQLAATGATDADSSTQAGTSTVTLTVVLNRSDQAEFERYVRDVQDPQSPSYRKWLGQAEMARRFGPSQEAYDRVLAFLERSGFTLVEGSANRLTLTVRGTRSQAERAFATEIHDYRLDDRTFYANDRDPALPAEIAPHVQAVVGLSNLARPHPATEAIKKFFCGLVAQAACIGTTYHDENGTAVPDKTRQECLDREYSKCMSDLSQGPQGGGNGPNPSGSGGPSTSQSLAALERRVLAEASPLLPRWIDVDGTGQVVGLLQLDAFNPSDISDYLAHVGLPASYINRLSRVPVNGGAPLGANQSEVLIDSLMVLLNATGANVVVYDAPFTGRNTSFQTLFNRMVNDGVTVISNSWAYCEDQTTLADVQSIDAILATAAASGISVFNASGDTGSTCLNGSPNTIAVPAGSPNATAVGGTSLTLGPALTYVSETWWDGPDDPQPTGQGGFGVSRFFSRPAYQNGFTGSPTRSIPDVAVNADPAKGIFLCQASAGGCPTGLQYGGTSIAAPTWAAFAALLNHAQGQNLGNLNPLLYPLAGTDAFHSPASMGSDFAHVGLGSPNLNRLHLALLGATAGPVSAAVSQVDMKNAAMPADGTETFVVVRLRDANGNTVSGKTVSLTAAGSPQVTIAPLTGISNVANGAVVFSVKSTDIGSVTFTATDVTDGIVLAQKPSLTFVTPSAAAGGINASPTTVTANGIATTTITVSLRDGLNRPTPGKLVTLSQGNGHSLITGPNPSVTDANGEIRFAATNLVNEVVTYKATDVSDGDLAVPGQAVVTFTNGSGGACGQNTPVPVGLNGYTVTPFATGFETGQLFFSNVNYGGCAGVLTPAFLGGSVYIPNFLNGDLFKLEPTGGVVSNANKLSTLGPTLGWPVVGKDGRLYASRAGTGGNFNTGIVIELDPNTGGILRTLVSGLTCPNGLSVDPLSGDLFFVDQCFGAGSDNPSLFRVKDPGTANPTLAVYATLPFTPNGTLAFSPKGTIYVVSGYLQQNPPVIRVSGTDGPNPPTVTALSGVGSAYWVNIGGVGPDGEATKLITLNDGKLKLTDITTNPPSTVVELTNNIGGGVIGPDGCLYMPNANAVYRLTDPTGGCSFLPTTASPSLALTPTAVSPDPAQGTGQTFAAKFRNVSVPAGTPVSFQITGANPQIKLVRTDANGQASFGYTAASAGPDTIVATATVDGSDLISNKAQVTWAPGRHTAFLTLNQSPTTGTAGTPVTVNAVLADVSLDPAARVTGASISFNAAGGSCNGVTDADGMASCELMPIGAPGSTTLSASFAGSSGLTPANASTAFMVVGTGGGNGGLAGVGPARIWVGLKNSDDVGTQFDLQVKVLIGNTVVAQGQTLCVTGLVRNPDKPKQVVVPLALVGDGSGTGDDVLRVRISTRVGTTPQGARCAGPGGSHSSARGLRLYYDGAKMPSSLGLQLAADPLENFFLDSNGGICANLPSPTATTFSLDETAPGATAPKCRDSGTVNYANGNPWQLIGTWSLPMP